MKREPKERTPEELEQMSRSNQQQYSLIAAIIWAICSIIWAVLLVLDILHDAATLQIVLHSVCTVLTAFNTVIHFVRWRRMNTADTDPAQQPLDSEDN